MSSKQQRAVKGKEHKVSQNQGWTALSWDDLTEWAGPRSVERGRAYQRQRRVHDLAISEDSWLLATVTGGERYAVTVWCEQSAKKGGALYSRCTCPVGASGCKHAAAVVAEYLERLGEGAETPVADQDDERWVMLADESGEEDDDDEADDLDLDSKDDDNEEVFYVHRHRHPEASGRKTLKASNEKIRKHIEAKSHDELVELVWALTERFPELREEFRDRIALGEGDVDHLVTEARKELRRVASEAGWSNSWTGEGNTPDYSRLKHRLERLLELGHPDAVVQLGPEIMKLGNEQIERSNDEGETAEAVGECMPVIFQAVAASRLTPARKLLFAIDAHLQDDFSIINDSTKVIFEMPVDSSIWSDVADQLASRLTVLTKGDDAFSWDYHRDQISDWLIESLSKAGREVEIIAICEQEACATGSYERLVKHLIEKRQYDEATCWATEGIKKTVAKQPGIASSLGKLMGEMAILRRQWAIAAAHAAWEFFERPSRESFQQLLKAAAKAGCGESVCNIALTFLETGVSPLASSKNAAFTKSKANAEWPLPMPAYLLPLLENESRLRPAAGPHFDVLIDMAIADRRQDDVLRWYDAMQAGQKHRGSPAWYGYSDYGDRVAAAVAESHPERSLAIYRLRVDDHLPHASASAYEAVASYLRKMRPILQALHREPEWNGLLADIRLRYKNRPKFMEILDKLDPRPIVEQRKARR